MAVRRSLVISVLIAVLATALMYGQRFQAVIPGGATTQCSFEGTICGFTRLNGPGTSPPTAYIDKVGGGAGNACTGKAIIIDNYALLTGDPLSGNNGSAVTFAMWVKDGEASMLRGRGNEPDDGWSVSLQTRGGFATFAIVGNHLQYDVSANIPAGWVHVAGVYDKTNIYLYVDGVQVKTKPASGALRGAGGKGFRLGQGNVGYPDTQSDMRDGTMDEMYAYAKALTKDEIVGLMNGSTPFCCGDTIITTPPEECEDTDTDNLDECTNSCKHGYADLQMVDITAVPANNIKEGTSKRVEADYKNLGPSTAVDYKITVNITKGEALILSAFSTPSCVITFDNQSITCGPFSPLRAGAALMTQAIDLYSVQRTCSPLPPGGLGIELEATIIPGTPTDNVPLNNSIKKVIPVTPHTCCGDKATQSINDDGLTETCDDGNAVSNDGCTAMCQSETDIATELPALQDVNDGDFSEVINVKLKNLKTDPSLTSVPAENVVLTVSATDSFVVGFGLHSPYDPNLKCLAVGDTYECSINPLPANADFTIPVKVKIKASANLCATNPNPAVSMEATATTTTPQVSNNTPDTWVELFSVKCPCGNGQPDAGEQCDGQPYCTACMCKTEYKYENNICVFNCPTDADAAAINQFCYQACANFGDIKPQCITDCMKVCSQPSSSSSDSSSSSYQSSYSGGSSAGGTEGGDIGGPGGGGGSSKGGGTQGGAGGTEGGAGGATGGGGGSSGRSSSRVSSRSSSRSSSSSSRASSVSSSRSSSISSVSSQSSSISSLGSSSSLSSLSSFSSSSSSSITACFGNNCLLGGNAACIAQQKTCVPNADPPNCFVCVGSSTSSTSSRSSVSSISSRSSSASSISSVQSFSSFAFSSSAPFCGNNILEAGEECESNQIPAGVDFTCQSCRIVFTNSCGDGRLDPGEECDDGNTANADGCSAICDIEFVTFVPSSSSSSSEFFSFSAPTLIVPPGRIERVTEPRCGDGLITLGEECDDANTRDFDGCSGECLLEVGRCGDGILQTLLGEQCEPVLHDGSNGSQCGADCRLILTTCGDANVDAGEECDEGAANHSDTLPDRCRTNCSAARCGDLVLDSVEQCDDGNRLGGDGCDRFCRREAGAPTTDVAANIIELPSLPFPPFTQQPPTASLTPIVQTHAPAGETGPAALAVMAAGAAAGYSWMRRRMKKK